MKWPELGRVGMWQEHLVKQLTQVNRDDKQDGVRWSGSCSLRLVEPGSKEDPDPEEMRVVNKQICNWERGTSQTKLRCGV